MENKIIATLSQQLTASFITENTEHIELLMLDNNQIRVAQYLTELPSKAWFADKLSRALEIAKQNTLNS